MADEEAEDMFFTNALGDGWGEVLHHPLEKVGCFQMRDVGNFFRSGDEDVLHHRRFRVESGIEIVFLCDLRIERLHLVSGHGEEKSKMGKDEECCFGCFEHEGRGSIRKR